MCVSANRGSILWTHPGGGNTYIYRFHHLGGSIWQVPRDRHNGDQGHGLMPRCDMTCPSPSPSSASVSDVQSHQGKPGPNKFDDEIIVLSPDHAERVARFREELRLYKTDPGGYELCVRIRNELLTEHTGVELLVAACEHVMFSQCAEYKDWRETRDKPGTQPVVPNDDVADWDRFLSVAKDGHEIKSKCLSALRIVANYWGQDIVQHYRWAYKGRKYCDKFCAVARKVQDWKTAVAGFNLLMLERSQQGRTLKRRPILASMNPIE